MPTFYERGVDDVPREWTRIMKRSMRTVNAEFNTNRMVEEYTERFYIPAVENAARLGAEGYAKARELADWRRRVHEGWRGLAITQVVAPPVTAHPMGTSLPVSATVALGTIPVDEVLVEVYHCLLDSDGQITDGEAATLFAGQDNGDGTVTFTGEIACRRAGQRGFTVRVVPRKNGYPLDRFETGLITWWEDPRAGTTASGPQTGDPALNRA